MPSGGTSSFRAQLLLVQSVPILDGRAKGGWLTIEYQLDETSTEAGVDGEGWFVDVGDFRALITVVLTEASIHNDYFASLLAENRSAPTGLAFSLSFSNLAGTASYAAARVKVKRTATGVWGDSAQVRTWVLETERLVGSPGSLIPTPRLTDEEAALLAAQALAAATP